MASLCSVTQGERGEMTVYWRPGCFYCSRLLAKLSRAGITHELVNIWDSPEAAATVRGHANGNETVPTVRVGNRWFVNPSLRELKKALAELER